MYRSKALNNYISNIFTMHNLRIEIMVQIILSMIKDKQTNSLTSETT